MADQLLHMRRDQPQLPQPAPLPPFSFIVDERVSLLHADIF